MMIQQSVTFTLRLPITFYSFPLLHPLLFFFFFFNYPAPTEIYPLPLHDPLPISSPTPTPLPTSTSPPPRPAVHWTHPPRILSEHLAPLPEPLACLLTPGAVDPAAAVAALEIGRAHV